MGQAVAEVVKTFGIRRANETLDEFRYSKIKHRQGTRVMKKTR